MYYKGALPVPDVKGYAVCQDYGSHVNSGTIRLANLKKCQCRKSHTQAPLPHLHSMKENHFPLKSVLEPIYGLVL